MKFQKTETRFCRWNSTDNNEINIFLSLENPCTFLLAKEKTWKRIFNTNSELSQNRTEKQIMPSKTTINWLFNVIYSLLVLIEKLAFFQPAVLKVYYILKYYGSFLLTLGVVFITFWTLVFRNISIWPCFFGSCQFKQEVTT